MKKLVVFLLIAAGAVAVARKESGKRAAGMIENASVLGDEGKYREALGKLNAVERWLSWTEPADRVEETRAAIRQLAERRGEAAELLPPGSRGAAEARAQVEQYQESEAAAEWARQRQGVYDQLEERSRAANESNARAWERQQEELRRARRIADSARVWRQERGLPVTAEDWRRIQEDAAQQAARTMGGGPR